MVIPARCCCGCPQIFESYPHPLTIQVDIVGNDTTNPQRIHWVFGAYVEERLAFDSFDLSAVCSLDEFSSGVCETPADGVAAACGPPVPFSGCCAYYRSSLLWSANSIEHKRYLASSPSGPWGYNPDGSLLRTQNAIPAITAQIYRYENTNKWYARIDSMIAFDHSEPDIEIHYALGWRGCAQIATGPLAAGTYDVPLDLTCNPFNGNDGITGLGGRFAPAWGYTWPDGRTAAGTATITVF